jgi:hypothetical protein
MVVSIIGILASMAVMSLWRGRAAANEAAAIASLRSIASGQIVYSSTCGRGNFAVRLTTLGVAPLGMSDGFLSPDLTAADVVQKSGYRLMLQASLGAAAGPNDCSGIPTRSGYYATAEPLLFGTTGNRSFATLSPTNVIWQANSGTAPAEPFAPPATTVQ